MINNEKGPGAITPQGHPEASPAATAGFPVCILNQGGRRRRAARQREAITCRVSLLLPSEHRKLWHYLCRCPACGSLHLGRAREPADVTGTRRLPCGHWIVVVVARTYGRTDSGAAA
jgi:hypothetical protein